jgi:hypothetical protein
MDEAFARAFYVPAFSAFGRKLMPYTLAHSFALLTLGCAAAEDAEGPGPTVADCGLAAYVCSLPPCHCRKLTTAPDLGAWILNLGPLDLDKEVAALDAYFAHYRAIPRRWQSGQGESPRAPWQWVAVARLCGMGMTTSTAWATPVCEAFALMAAHDVYEGDRSLMTERERAIVEGAGNG